MSDDLPEGWARARLRDGVVAGAQTGFACGKHSRNARGVAHLRPMNVSDAGRLRLDDVKFIDSAEVDRDERWIRSGDVLFNNTNSPELVGKTAVYTEDAPRAFSNHMTRVRCTAAADPHFLAHAIHQKWREGLFASICNNHVSQASISTDVLLDLELPVPPLAEQRRIVAKVEALLEQVRRAKDRLDRVPLILQRFRQAVLAAACSGQFTEAWRVAHPDRQAPSRPMADRVARTRRQGANISKDGQLLTDDMPDLPNSWAYWRSDEVVDPDTVVTYGIVLPGPEHPGGVPYVRQQDIVDGGILVNELRHTTPTIAAKHARSTLRAGDVLLCIIRNLRVAMVPKGLDGANITQGAVRLRPGQHVRGDYLAAYLACPAAQGWMKARYFGMDMPRINVEDARAIPIALPPIDEQAKIMRRVDALFRLEEKVRGRLAASINRAGALPQAILSKAFAGELVPTEADLARAENRDYETAEHALDRLRREVEGGVSRRPANKARGTRTD
jgi:type I restriction enzyme S subunit